MSPSHKIDSIQSLRGILAFVVFLGHTWGFYESASFTYLSRTPLHIFFDGQIAVFCFFVLSGFFQKFEDFQVKSYVSRICRRLIRLLPAYIITTVLAYIIYKVSTPASYMWLSSWGNELWNHDYQIIDLVRQLIFLPTQSHTWIDPAAWYMQQDVTIMILMPLLIGLSCRYRSVWLLLLAIPLSCVTYTSVVFPATIGVLVAIINRRENSPRFTSTGFLLLLAIMGLFCLDIRNIWLEYTKTVTDYIQAVGAGMLLYSIVHSDVKFLKNKYLVWFGNYSYEFYLIHMVVMLALMGCGLNHGVFVMLVFVISLLSSVFLHKISAAISEKIRPLK